LSNQPGDLIEAVDAVYDAKRAIATPWWNTVLFGCATAWCWPAEASIKPFEARGR
jgi:hypothetical protein